MVKPPERTRQGLLQAQGTPFPTLSQAVTVLAVVPAAYKHTHTTDSSHRVSRIQHTHTIRDAEAAGKAPTSVQKVYQAARTSSRLI